MDVQQLRCFLAVAEELHFGRAAERLHMTASPLSRSIKDLERELGAELFVRGYHTIELTLAGRELYLRVPPLLAEFDRLRSDIQLVAAGEERVVRLGGSHLSPPRILDVVVECAEQGNPGRRVDVVLGSSAELLTGLGRGELDAAVVHLPVDTPLLEALPLASYGFNIVMRRHDPLAGRESLAVAELGDRMVVTMPFTLQPRTMQRMHDELTSKGLRHLRTVSGADTAMIAGQVRRSGDLALTVAPRLGGPARVFDDPAFAIVPLTDGPRLHLGLAWLSARATDPVVSNTVTAVRKRWPDGETEM